MNYHPKVEPTQGLRIVITGGVTGGHLFPGVALAEEFTSRDSRNRVQFMSIGNELEKKVLEKKGFELIPVRVQGIKGRGIVNLIKSVFKLPSGLWRAVQSLRNFNPHLVISMGSYAAGPATLGAWLLGKKTVLCEQNILPGVTQRLLSLFAERIYVSFEETGKKFSSAKVRCLGNPVRSEILAALSKQEPFNPEKDSGAKPFSLLIVGGSQGAHSINMTMIEALGCLEDKKRFRFVHQTGVQDEVLVRHAYEVYGTEATVAPFFEDMGNLYHEADLVICRSGATTVAELTALGKPALFIPFPHAADDHQVLNARSLVVARAADMIFEEELTGQLLAEKIQYYAANRILLFQMAEKSKLSGHPDAAKNIVEDCCELLGGSQMVFSGSLNSVVPF
ncbi:MAG: undecaprenyldiphospho-muramoylpentapeptide beta-N-acetylglucosaminyltransferase [Desulfobacteraceae bacterium]|nr:undecaprenyldiphospho-muramoylpentapeptide beta-N-acetylglucosaminyltransferase [Desulfobacteraceae bacterium]